MELIVFDLDGTLLNANQRLSPFTREILHALGEQNIAYTVATGRTLHAAVPCLDGHEFKIPQVYKNGVLIWDPLKQHYTHCNYLQHSDVGLIIEVFTKVSLTPFVMGLNSKNHQLIFHGDVTDQFGEKMMDRMHGRHDVSIMPVSSIINQQKYITNITAIGQREDIVELITQLESVPGLVAFYGMDMYGDSHYWVDIHRSDATKGGAIELLKEELGFSRVICFGDSDNDISLFQFADECYAPENADPELKKLATAIIGHHDQDGIARFLNERFKLGIKESQ